MDALGEELSVFVCGIFGCFRASSFQCNSVSLVLHALGSNKSLDLGGFRVWLSTLFLRDNFSSDDEFSG